MYRELAPLFSFFYFIRLLNEFGWLPDCKHFSFKFSQGISIHLSIMLSNSEHNAGTRYWREAFNIVELQKWQWSRHDSILLLFYCLSERCVKHREIPAQRNEIESAFLRKFKPFFELICSRTDRLLKKLPNFAANFLHCKIRPYLFCRLLIMICQYHG